MAPLIQAYRDYGSNVDLGNVSACQKRCFSVHSRYTAQFLQATRTWINLLNQLDIA